MSTFRQLSARKQTKMTSVYCIQCMPTVAVDVLVLVQQLLKPSKHPRPLSSLRTNTAAGGVAIGAIVKV